MKKGLCLIISAFMIAALAGCSATDVVDDLVEETAGTSEIATPEPSAAAADTREADPSIAAPEFEVIISGSTNMAVGSTIELAGTAKSPDGGTITYQWYRNNVDANGGGTPIAGATQDKYTARAEEPGSTFYYVVAANNHGNKCNMITSSTYEVVTYKDGEWTKDEFGLKYVNEDGTYPVELWLMIEGDVYHFDSAGYITTGWFASGNNYYYFDEDGKILANGETPDGYKTDENGRLIGNGVPQLYPTTAEIAAQAKAAADAQGDAAANAAEQEKADAARRAAGQTEDTSGAEGQGDAAAEAQPAEEQPAAEEQIVEESSGEEYVDDSAVYEENGGE